MQDTEYYSLDDPLIDTDTGIYTFVYDPIDADTYYMKVYIGQNVRLKNFPSSLNESFTTTFDSDSIPQVEYTVEYGPDFCTIHLSSSDYLENINTLKLSCSDNSCPLSES